MEALAAEARKIGAEMEEFSRRTAKEVAGVVIRDARGSIFLLRGGAGRGRRYFFRVNRFVNIFFVKETLNIFL